jgi:hypothetical protein
VLLPGWLPPQAQGIRRDFIQMPQPPPRWRQTQQQCQSRQGPLRQLQERCGGALLALLLFAPPIRYRLAKQADIGVRRLIIPLKTEPS